MAENFEPQNRIYRPRLKMMFDNFLGGLSWSLGVFVGATIVVGIIGLLLPKINLIPIIGSFVNQVIEVSKQYGVK